MESKSLQALLETLGGEKRINYGLDRLSGALDRLGNPHRSAYSLIIAGTNGKGGTTLLTSAALVEAGFRVGTYLSPHLQHPRERMLRNLDPIGERELEELALAHEPLAREFDLTYFEYLTLLFLVWARRERFDFMVLEVGLGGRLDATNVVDALAGVVTNIAFDHQAYLGNTLEAILDEKLGVIRPEGLCFSGVEEEVLKARLEARCNDLDAIYYHAQEIRRSVRQRGWGFQDVTLNDYPFRLGSPSHGTLKNAALAFLLLRIVFPRLPVETLQRGFASVVFPGRLEVVADSPRVVLSGDHNPAGLESTLATLRGLDTGKLYTVCAFSPDKPYGPMYRRLEAVSEDIRLTRFKGRRGPLPEDYASTGRFQPDPQAALDEMLARAGSGDTVLVTGSLYLVGEVRPRWRPDVRFRAGSPGAPGPSARAGDDATGARLRPEGPGRRPAP